ncbi:uncharacterized protein LOC34618793 [Cyclospora cayetanensis]|uniref:Uncharacterized protein LOC34618793 n=1 Tax=Cyclospora cayetanensis TaxID=88456 RepID=A0A6P6RZ69_9EIME|nr:uncharacterized protein LOC34618793 [Cyclospora cayetanensis]
MGILQSHEAARGHLWPSQGRQDHYGSSSKASATHCHVGQGKAKGFLPAFRIGEMKLKDATTSNTTASSCCTTRCGSSRSGTSIAPDLESWVASGRGGKGTARTAVTMTRCTDSSWERSESAQAVSGKEDVSPIAFDPAGSLSAQQEASLRDAERSVGGKSRHTRGMRSLLVPLKLRGSGRCHSQPPETNHSEGSTASCGGDLLADCRSVSAAAAAAALRAHVEREEQEHRRRRHSDLFFLPSSSSASPSSALQKRGEFPLAQERCLADAKPAGSSIPPHLPLSAENVDAAEASQSCETADTATSSELPQPSQPCSWIADTPPDGQWEIERGVWNRQGVHLNHTFVVDERYKAMQATLPRRGSRQDSSAAACLQSHFPCSHGPSKPAIITPFASRLQKQLQQQQQQRLHASAETPLVPMTHRGVAAATTIEIARKRQAKEALRRLQQHRLITDQEAQQAPPAAAPAFATPEAKSACSDSEKSEAARWKTQKATRNGGVPPAVCGAAHGDAAGLTPGCTDSVSASPRGSLAASAGMPTPLSEARLRGWEEASQETRACRGNATHAQGGRLPAVTVIPCSQGGHAQHTPALQEEVLSSATTATHKMRYDAISSSSPNGRVENDNQAIRPSSSRYHQQKNAFVAKPRTNMGGATGKEALEGTWGRPAWAALRETPGRRACAAASEQHHSFKPSPRLLNRAISRGRASFWHSSCGAPQEARLASCLPTLLQRCEGLAQQAVRKFRSNAKSEAREATRPACFRLLQPNRTHCSQIDSNAWCSAVRSHEQNACGFSAAAKPP